MGIAEAQVERTALDGGTETDALNFEILAEAFADAVDHVADQALGRAMKGTNAAVVRLALNENGGALLLEIDAFRQRVAELALRAFNENAAVVSDLEVHLGGKRDGLFSYA